MIGFGFRTNPLQKCDGRFTGTKLTMRPYLGTSFLLAIKSFRLKGDFLLARTAEGR
jgi:hypothetical protein